MLFEVYISDTACNTDFPGEWTCLPPKPRGKWTTPIPILFNSTDLKWSAALHYFFHVIFAVIFRSHPTIPNYKLGLFIFEIEALLSWQCKSCATLYKKRPTIPWNDLTFCILKGDHKYQSTLLSSWIRFTGKLLLNSSLHLSQESIFKWLTLYNLYPSN